MFSPRYGELSGTGKVDHGGFIAQNEMYGRASDRRCHTQRTNVRTHTHLCSKNFPFILHTADSPSTVQRALLPVSNPRGHLVPTWPLPLILGELLQCSISGPRRWLSGSNLNIAISDQPPVLLSVDNATVKQQCNASEDFIKTYKLQELFYYPYKIWIENFIEHYLETCSIPHQGQSQRRADVLVPSSSRSQVSSTPTRFRGPPLHGYVQVRVRDARMSWSPPLVALKSPLLLHDFVVPRYTAMYRSESETRGCPGPLL